MLLKSMTGFGRCEAVNEECKITVEMKSVNHRYLDLSIKMPKKFNVYEAGIRMILKEYIQRGKVDILDVYKRQHFPLQKPGNFIISLRLMSQEFLSFHRKIQIGRASCRERV